MAWSFRKDKEKSRDSATQQIAKTWDKSRQSELAACKFAEEHIDEFKAFISKNRVFSKWLLLDRVKRHVIFLSFCLFVTVMVFVFHQWCSSGWALLVEIPIWGITFMGLRSAEHRWKLGCLYTDPLSAKIALLFSESSRAKEQGENRTQKQ